MDPSTPGPLAFDESAIDFAGRRLLRDGIEQPLEPKAFAVLALLAGAPGRVFTRDEILDAVWGHRNITPGVLNRVMTLLRHALGEDAQAARYLHTVHGVGYRFDLPEPAPGAPRQAIQAPDPEATAPAPAPVPAPAPAMRRRASDRRALPRGMPWLLPLLALLAFAGWTWWPRTPPALAPVMEHSIAVLPLVNAGNDPQQLYFSDGLSENLIDALSRFQGLKVIGRTSAFQFRDSKDDSATIGRKLGVSHLLTGSVQHAGDVVRINASLTRAADGRTLWAEHYDRPYKNLFALQDEITQAVAAALQVKLLSPAAAAKPNDRPPSASIEAYSAYLQGLRYWHDQDFPKAAEHMSQAVQLDPGYAVAWAHLSGAWSTVAAFSNEAPAVAREHMRQSRIAADKALQLAPGLGPAHAARAYLQFYSFDHRGALAECRRAVQLAPADGTVLNGCGYVLGGIGKLGEAIRLREQLLSIEPLYTVNYYQYAKLLAATGQLDKATKYLRIAEGLPQPESAPWNQRMAIAIARGDLKTAQEVARHQPSPWREMNLAIAMQISPDRAAADAALAKILADKVEAKTSPYAFAQAYALRGDADKTLAWLERAPAHDLLFMLADPLLLRLRDDPRLIAFCQKTGLPAPGESDALSIDQIRAADSARNR
ncbi:winged helix-turn-helix domain-containing tetratricopeptide repeat protein [Rhodanobacter ginsengiterrae]|uniref:winged helix-turn-helix domain-containing tetratricopeptide repeat protein n=1 Tax=Rhodanobacter ginsengiterrae TaxID=2008451 RepID=UPI003CEB9C93